MQQLVSGQRWETGELRCLAAAAVASAAAAAAAAVAAAAVAVLDKAHPTIGQSASHPPPLKRPNVNFGEPALLMLNLRLVTNQGTSFVSIRVLDTESNPKIVTQHFEPLI